MASVHRLIVVLLVAFAAWLPASSFASFPASTGVLWSAYGSAPGWDVQTALVNRCVERYGATYNVPSNQYQASATQWSATCRNSSGSSAGDNIAVNSFSSATCPANATLSGTTCTCNATFVQSGTTSAATCISAAVAAQQVADALNYLAEPLVGSGGGLNTCYGGYVMKASGSASGGNVTEYFPPFTSTGAACAVAATKPIGAAACSSTEYFGQVNGVDTCVAATTTVAGGESTAAPAPAGSASNPVSGLDSSAPPGATGKSTTTTCQAGSCNTITNYTNSSGASVGSKTETRPQPTFCAENPASSVCVQKTLSGGGSCSAAPTCTGDAIACSIAQQTWKTACALTVDANAESGLYDSKKALTGSQVPDGGTVSLSLGSTSDLLNGAGAGGVQDQTIQIWGNSFTVPLSNVNTPLAMIGNIFLAVCFIVAVRIVREG